MTTSVSRNGEMFKLADLTGYQLLEKLPPAIYTLRFDPENGLHLLIAQPFELPDKIYSTLKAQASRIVNTFLVREGNTGVLLSGEKGSGKTLLTKIVCCQLLEQAIPTILVNQVFAGDAFNEFINRLPQRAVVLFDEFEKVYGSDEGKAAQEQMLPLLDGVGSDCCLFLLTANDTWGLNSNLFNRPGRIYYRLDFTGLDEKFVREYCDDCLDDQSQVSRILHVTSAIRSFNFDMLKALIDEMNRYHETPVQALEYLNINLEATSDLYTVRLYRGGKLCDVDADTVHLSPLRTNGFYISYTVNRKQVQLVFSSDDIVATDGFNGIYKFAKDDFELTLTQLTLRRYSLDADQLAMETAKPATASRIKNGKAEKAAKLHAIQPPIDMSWAQPGR